MHALQQSCSDKCVTEDISLVTESPKTSSVNNSPSAAAKAKAKKAGCRCGNATLCPGKLTCCGQRCPCYVDALPCIDCKCKVSPAANERTRFLTFDQSLIFIVSSGLSQSTHTRWRQSQTSFTNAAKYEGIDISVDSQL